MAKHDISKSLRKSLGWKALLALLALTLIATAGYPLADRASAEKALARLADCPTTPNESAFYEAWQCHQGELGCPINRVHTVFTAEQPFLGGQMYWRSDTRQIYVIYHNGISRIFQDEWSEGMPEDSCPDVEPPGGGKRPIRGFGKVWCENPDVRAELRGGIHKEGGHDDLVEDFENGTILCDSNRVIYVILDNGTSFKYAKENLQCSPPLPEEELGSTTRLFEYLSAPTQINRSPQAWGIWDMQLWKDRIYLAHGDWTINAGPIPILYYDLSSGRFVHDQDFYVNEESIDLYRVIDGNLYIPGVDARERSLATWLGLPHNVEWDWGNLYFRTEDGDWIKRRTIPQALHVLDVARYKDALYVATGSAAYRPRSTGENCAKGYCSFGGIYASTDEGQSWTAVYTDTEVSRFWGLHPYREKLYVTYGGDCRVFDGSQWDKAACLPPGAGPVRKDVVFQEVLVLIPDHFWDGPLYLFDGEQSEAVAFDQPVRDALVANGHLFVLTGDREGAGAIYEASNLSCRCRAGFTKVTDIVLGSWPTAFEYAKGRFFVGLRDGRIFQAQRAGEGR